MSGGELGVHLAAIVLKATAILLAGALLAAVGRRAPARVRHALWTAVLVAVILLPALHLAVPARTPAWLRLHAFRAWTAPASAHEGPLPPPSARVETVRGGTVAASAPASAPSRPPWSVLVLAAWACGALLAGGRAMAGVVRRRRIDLAARGMEDDGCREVLARAAVRLGVRTPGLRMLPGAVPATWGVLRPVILLPASARAWPADRLQAVLHHELAHVRRRDALWCGVAECASTLFWFHPGVWLARRAALRAQEQAADDLVLRTGGDRFSYARALLETARLYAHLPADAAPAFFRGRSELASRLRRLTHAPAVPEAGGRPLAALPLLLAAAVAFIVPLRPAAALDPPLREAVTIRSADLAAGRASPGSGASRALPASASAFAAAPDTPPPARPGLAAAPVLNGATGNSYGRGMVAAGLGPASAAALQRLRDLGVTPGYVREMRAAGLRLQAPGDVVSLWIQGVTPAFVRQVRSAGMPLQAPADAVELWIHKVPAAFIRELANAGVDVSGPASIRTLHNHGVRPAYVRELARAGLPLRQPAQVLEMHIHHVPAEFVGALADAGVDVSRPTSIRVLHNHGVRPAYVRELARAGMPLRDPAHVLEMHIHGVPAEFVGALAATGLRGLTAREARRLHNFDIDPRDPAQIRTVAGYDRALARIPSLLPG